MSNSAQLALVKEIEGMLRCLVDDEVYEVIEADLLSEYL